MVNRKSVLFLINSMSIGGAERVLTNMVNSLPADKLDITVTTLLNGGMLSEKLNSNIHHKSIIKVKNKFIEKLCAYIISFILPPSLTHKLFIGKKYDYEVAFLEGVPTKIIAASGNKKSVKYAWVHIDLYNTFGINKIYKSMDRHRECYKKFDKIICVSKTVKDAFIRRFGNFNNIDVKYNIIDDCAIKKYAGEAKELNDRFKVVSVGRLENQKGFDRLLRIHKRLIDEGFDYDLIIVGEGSKHQELDKFIYDNGLEKCTSLAGHKENPYVYIKSADLLVFPSRAEGMSTVVTESVIIGKPVVVSDCSGMREILGDSEYGLITDNNDDAIYEGMKKMITDKRLRVHYEEKAKERSNSFAKAARLKEIEKLFN